MDAANDNEPIGRACTKCGEWKVFAEFHTRKLKDGTRRPVAACKACANARGRANAAKNASAVVERVRQWRLLPGNMERKNSGERERRKAPDVKAKIAVYGREYSARPEVRAAANRRKRERRATDEAHRLAERAAAYEYYHRPDVWAANKEKRKEKTASREFKDSFNEYRRKRYAEDPIFVCQIQISGFVGRTIEKSGGDKSDRSHKILGYTADQLRQRIECQFRYGMSWSNRGEWHIDHKKPIAEFLRNGVVDPRIINSLCNLQPLWAHENQSKGDKWPYFVAANDNYTRSQQCSP